MHATPHTFRTRQEKSAKQFPLPLRPQSGYSLGFPRIVSSHRQHNLPIRAVVACCDIGTLFNPVILSGTLSFGKANDKVESKDPMFVDTTPGNARRSHRAVIARGPAKAAHATKLI